MNKNILRTTAGRRVVLFATAFFSVGLIMLAGCHHDDASKNTDEDQATAVAVSNEAEASDQANEELVRGPNYLPQPDSFDELKDTVFYVGAPKFKIDKWGRIRVAGPVTSPSKDPPRKGLVVGLRELPFGAFVFTSWLGGRMITRNWGHRREDGTFWYDRRETFTQDGRITRSSFVYKDDEEMTYEHREEFDPKTGEVLLVNDYQIPFRVHTKEEEDETNSEDGTTVTSSTSTTTVPSAADAPEVPEASAMQEK